MNTCSFPFLVSAILFVRLVKRPLLHLGRKRIAEAITHGCRTVAIDAGVIAGLESSAPLDALGIPAESAKNLERHWGSLVHSFEEMAQPPYPQRFPDRMRGPMRPVDLLPDLPVEGVNCLPAMERLVEGHLPMLERIESWQRFEGFAAIYGSLANSMTPTSRRTIQAEVAFRDGLLAVMFGMYWARAAPARARQHVEVNLEEMRTEWSQAVNRGLQLLHPESPYPSYDALSGDVRTLLATS